MGILTWQNVPTPDLSGSQQGIRTAGDLLNKALGNASTGVAQLQALEDQRKAAEVEAADRFVQERMLAEQDPEKYAQMLASGALIGPAAGTVSPAMLKQLDARRDDLRTRSEAEYDVKLKHMLDNAAPTITAAAQQAPTNFEGSLKTLGQANLPGRPEMEVQKHLLAMRLNPKDLAAGKNDLEERAAQDLAAETIRRLSQVNSDPVKSREILDSLPKDQIGNQASLLVKDRMNKEDPTFSTTVASPNATLGNERIKPNGNSGYVKGNGLDRWVENLDQVVSQNGGPPAPGSHGEAHTYGQVYDYGQEHVLPTSQQYFDKETSASGPYQIVTKNFAKYGPKVLGDNWRDAPRTVENDYKIAKAIYEKEGPKAWAAFNNFKSFTPEFFKGKKFEDVADLIKVIDGGVLPDDYQNRIALRAQTIEKVERNAPAAVKIINKSKAMSSMDSAEVAAYIAKAYPNKDENQWIGLKDYIDAKTVEARKKGLDISEGEIGGMLLQAMEQDTNWATWADLANNTINVKNGLFDQLVENIEVARVDAKNIEQGKAKQQKLIDLATNYGAEEGKLQQALRAAKIQENSGNGAIREAKELTSISNQIRKELGSSKDGDSVKIKTPQEVKTPNNNVVNSSLGGAWSPPKSEELKKRSKEDLNQLKESAEKSRLVSERNTAQNKLKLIEQTLERFDTTDGPVELDNGAMIDRTGALKLWSQTASEVDRLNNLLDSKAASPVSNKKNLINL